MKKISFVILLFSCFLLVSCGKDSKKEDTVVYESVLFEDNAIKQIVMTVDFEDEKAIKVKQENAYISEEVAESNYDAFKDNPSYKILERKKDKIYFELSDIGGKNILNKTKEEILDYLGDNFKIK